MKNQVELLRNEGLHIDVVFGDWSIRNIKRLLGSKLQKNISTKGITWKYSAFFYPRIFPITMKLWRKAYIRLIGQYIAEHGLPDIIHTHTYLAGWIAFAIKEKYGIPYCMTEHSTLILSDELTDLHRKMAVEAYNHADGVLAVSRSLSTVIIEKYGVSSSVMPNFIDVNLFKPASNNADASVLKIICIGELIDRKQIEILLKSLKGIAFKYHLSIVGDGPLRNTLEKLVLHLGLSDVVTFEGRLSQENISELLCKMDVLVHPSRLETFGIVLIEALSSGVPVIAFKNGGSEDIINETNGILINDMSIDSLHAAIKKMILSPDQYDRNKIRSNALTKYAPDVVKHQLLQQYSSIMSKKQNTFNQQSEK